MTWRNVGRAAHVLTPRNGGFRRFTLAPSRRKTVKFNRAGCFRYSVDRRLNGAVAVGTGRCSAAPTGSGGSGSARGVRVVRYDLRVETNLHWEEHRGGANKLTLAWVGTWTGVRFRIQDRGDEVHVRLVGQPLGAFTGTMRFEDTNPDAPPCKGEFTYPRFEMKVFGGGDWTRASGMHLEFQFFLDYLGPGQTFDQVTLAEQSRCGPGHLSTLPFWLAPDPMSPSRIDVRGVFVDPPGSGIHQADARFERTTPAAIAFPLTSFRAGRGFTIDTGVQVVPLQPCTQDATDCKHTSTGRLRFTFTARP